MMSPASSWHHPLSDKCYIGFCGGSLLSNGNSLVSNFVKTAWFVHQWAVPILGLNQGSADGYFLLVTLIETSATHEIAFKWLSSSINSSTPFVHMLTSGRITSDIWMCGCWGIFFIGDTGEVYCHWIWQMQPCKWSCFEMSLWFV